MRTTTTDSSGRTSGFLMQRYKSFLVMAALAVSFACASFAQAKGGHGGGNRGGHGGGHVHTGARVGVFIGPAWYPPFYPYYYPPYYYPYYYPPVVPAPTTYIEQASPQTLAQGYWYYCGGSNGYYPYVKECPGGWQQVPPAPAQ
jgi:hypothetical protein